MWRALLDRARWDADAVRDDLVGYLYLPRQWADDWARRTAAKVPENITFATKPQLAQRMIGRAVAAQVPFAWITGDEVYGDNRSLRVWLEQQELHFVLAVASNQYVWVNVDCQKPVGQLAAMVQPQDWITLPSGNGAKGPRLYLQTLVPVAGARWTVEECFEATKGEVGLDQYEVRSWHGWYRHITLAMLAHAYLSTLASAAAPAPVKKRYRQAGCDIGSSNGYMYSADGTGNS